MENKNIFVLPTDKPSRLYYWKGNDTYNSQFRLRQIAGFCDFNQNDTVNQNIYITNLEKPKEGDWVFDVFKNACPTIRQLKTEEEVLSVQETEFKIILTDNKELIADGVQEVSEEFLQWFIKNPSCEKIEVKRNKKLSNKSIWDVKEGDLVFNNHNCGGVIEQLSNDIRVHIISENGEGYMETAITSDSGKDTLIINNYRVYEYSDYKIIIPSEDLKFRTVNVESATDVNWKSDIINKIWDEEEEPKQKVICTNEICQGECIECNFMSVVDIDKSKDIPYTGKVWEPTEKEEWTIEEAAERLYPTTIDSFTDTGIDMSEAERLIFINGAKWQKNDCVQFINKLEDESFDGWSEEAISGYLAACMTIKKKLDAAKNY